MLEPFHEVFPPIVVLWENDEGCEQAITSGDVKWDLVEVNEGLESALVVGVLDAGEAIMGPTGVDSGEGKREGGKGWRPNSESDWWIVDVRKLWNSDWI